MVMKKCFRILLTCILALSFSIGVSYAQEADITELKTDVDTNKQKTSDNNSKIQTLEQKVVTVEEKVAVTEQKITTLEVYSVVGKSCPEGSFVKGSTSVGELICGTPDVGRGAADPVSLLAYYPFDGNVSDASGNGYDGSVTGAEQYTSGHDGSPGAAFSFNGSTFISTQLDIDVSAEPKLTMGGWMWSSGTLFNVMTNDDGSFDRSILFLYDEWLAYDGYESGTCGDNWEYCWTGPIDSTGGWEFVAVVYDQDAQSSMLYVDGNVVKNIGEVVGPSNNMFHMGYNPYNGSEWFTGLLDEAFVVSGALSISDLDQIRSKGVRSLFP
jgi:hypothetical protein